MRIIKKLRNLYFANVCPDDFYHRAFDLNEKQDIKDFIEDFKISKAIALLRKCKELNGINVNRSEITTSLNIVKKRLKLLLGETDLENKFNNVKQRTFSRTYTKNPQFEIEKVSDKDWEIISNENIEFYHTQIENIIKTGLLPKENKASIEQVPMVKAPNKNTKAPKIKSNKNNLEKKISKKNDYIKSEEDK